MAKQRRPVAEWAGRELKAMMHGQEVCVKLDPCNKTYYCSVPRQGRGGRDRKWLSTDLAKAAVEFWRLIEEGLAQSLVHVPQADLKRVPELPPDIALMMDKINRMGAKAPDRAAEKLQQKIALKYTQTYIPETILAAIFREWLTDPYQCSIRVGDERLAMLDQLTPVQSIPLKEMGDYYYDFVPTNREQASDRERQKVRGWWSEFVKLTGRAMLDEITKADIQRYTSKIILAAKKEGRSPTWIGHRFSAVGTVLRVYRTKLEDKTLVNKVLGWLKDFPCPKQVNGNGDTYDPQRLTREQWQELLDVVSQGKSRTQKEWKAIILFALNTCSYGIDCRQVQMCHIKGHELRLRRSKTGVAKIGWLWDETLAAISEFRSMGKIDGSPYVFPSRAGGEYTEGGWYDYWSRHIRPKLSFKWDFEQLRDSGRYGAETGEASSNSILMAMGHRLPGVSDNYLFRHPELVQPVAEAIHKYYME